MRRRTLFALAAAWPVTLTGPAVAAETLRFWNQTAGTITDLRLAPPGTGRWGENQCLNDPDKAVDADERLRLSGVVPGRYDVRVTKKSGGVCVVRNVELRSGGKFAFALTEEDLQNCTK